MLKQLYLSEIISKYASEHISAHISPVTIHACIENKFLTCTLEVGDPSYLRVLTYFQQGLYGDYVSETVLDARCDRVSVARRHLCIDILVTKGTLAKRRPPANIRLAGSQKHGVLERHKRVQDRLRHGLSLDHASTQAPQRKSYTRPSLLSSCCNKNGGQIRSSEGRAQG